MLRTMTWQTLAQSSVRPGLPAARPQNEDHRPLHNQLRAALSVAPGDHPFAVTLGRDPSRAHSC